MQKVRRFLSNVQIPLRILYIRAFELSKKVKIAWGGVKICPPSGYRDFPTPPAEIGLTKLHLFWQNYAKVNKSNCRK